MSENIGQVTASVRVEFVMEYQSGPWGMDCEISQVIRQAHDEADAAARAVLVAVQEAPHGVHGAGRLIRIAKIHGPSIHIAPESVTAARLRQRQT